MNPANVNHQHTKLLEGISQFLKENPIIAGLAYQDLTKGGILKKTGGQGMAAEQVLRAAVVKMIREFCYEDLAFHLVNSTCYRNFCGIPYCHKGFKKSALCKNIKTVSAETWEALNKVVIAYAEGKGIEQGRESRFDSTVVSSDIHSPSDSSLLYDAVRVITRLVKRAGIGLSGMEVPFTDHTRRAKRRMIGIQNAKGKPQRTKTYRDLLKVAGKSLGYGERVLEEIRVKVFVDPEEALMAMALAEEL